MARLRTIKPGFFHNEALGDLEPLARLLFAGLWTIADREGRLEDRPRRIKIEVLPYDECDADALLAALADAGFITRYRIGDSAFIAIPAFLKHQNPHMHEAQSVIPDHSDGLGTVPVPDKHSACTVQAQDKPGSSCLGSCLESCLGNGLGSCHVSEEGQGPSGADAPNDVCIESPEPVAPETRREAHDRQGARQTRRFLDTAETDLAQEFEAWFETFGGVGVPERAFDCYRWWRTSGKASAANLLTAAEGHRRHCEATNSRQQAAGAFLRKPTADDARSPWTDWADVSLSASASVSGAHR